MFTKGDVAIFSAAAVLLDAMWDSNNPDVKEIRDGILKGATRSNVREAVLKISLILMMDVEDAEEESKPQASKIRKSVQEDGDGVRIVFSED